MKASSKPGGLPVAPEIDPASDDSSIDLIAEALPDHRIAYLEYEGPVSGDRGEVRRWDRGSLTLLELNDDSLVALLTGEELAGRVTLKKNGSGKSVEFELHSIFLKSDADQRVKLLRQCRQELFFDLGLTCNAKHSRLNTKGRQVGKL